MDEIDMKILELLENNGRLSHEEIGKRLNMSRPAIHNLAPPKGCCPTTAPVGLVLI